MSLSFVQFKNYMFSDDAIQLATSVFPSLERLDLDGTRITIKGMKQVKGFPKLRSLLVYCKDVSNRGGKGERRGRGEENLTDFLQQRNWDSKDWLVALEPHLERLIMYDHPPVPSSPFSAFIIPSSPSSFYFVDIYDAGRENLIACSSDYVLTAISFIIQSSTLSPSAYAILTYVQQRKEKKAKRKEERKRYKVLSLSLGFWCISANLPMFSMLRAE